MVESANFKDCFQRTTKSIDLVKHFSQFQGENIAVVDMAHLFGWYTLEFHHKTFSHN